MTARSLPEVAIVHSNLSPGLSWRNTAMPSGIVALSDFDFGRAIEILDLRLIANLLFGCYLFLPICWQNRLCIVQPTLNST